MIFLMLHMYLSPLFLILYGFPQVSLSTLNIHRLAVVVRLLEFGVYFSIYKKFEGHGIPCIVVMLKVWFMFGSFALLGDFMFGK